MIAFKVNKIITNPKRRINPHVSRRMPISAHPIRTSRIPPKKSEDPFILCH